MTRAASILGQKSVVLIFAYAPAGLGHLRVTDALYSGLPETVQPLLMGSHDRNIMWLHRIFSIHPLLRNLFEWVQYNPQQYIFTFLYYWLTRMQSDLMYEQLNTILDQRLETPQQIVIVATHFTLAHQIGIVKRKIEQERKVQVILAVQVTDDSPQFMWYVPEADLTFVPSSYTKRELEKYGEWVGHPAGNFVVNAYPISPILAERLDHGEFFEKSHQIDPKAKSQIHVSIPVSGAAVGLHYATRMIDTLHRASHRFMFHVVTRSAPYTLGFLNEMIQRPYVKLYVSAQDRDVVNAYEHVYRKYLVSIEITKPSEQAFKTLLYPEHRGGSILLFSEPVGRQEYDNISFMRRHGLIPSEARQERLFDHSTLRKALSPGHEIREEARNWRGTALPEDPEAAGRYVWWCIQNGIFESMMQFRPRKNRKPAEQIELSPHGVREFWEKIADYLNRSDTV
ncbi:MAG: hypothetical protein N2691_05145 [Patescibacteria group bacterium]|nr:hypothetical protein [Patescibacteria group bacterium]